LISTVRATPGIGGIRPTMDEMSDKQMLVTRHAD
jgi:hypothetical protein